MSPAKNHLKRIIMQVLIALTIFSYQITLAYKEEGGELVLEKSHNVTIGLNQNGKFTCQFKKRIEDETFSFDLLNVQWIIDNFGYTKVDLDTIFGNRFHFNYDEQHGNFDLTLNNATMEHDESTFTCQINYKLNREDTPSTISNDLVYLNIIISPKQVSLVQKIKLSSYDDTKVIKEIFGESLSQGMSASETQVADAPHSPESLISFNRDLFTKQQTKQHAPIKENYSTSKGPTNNKLEQTFWFVENQTSQVICNSAPSKPKVKLIWLLDGLRLENNGMPDDDRGILYTMTERYYNETNKDLTHDNTPLIRTENTMEVILTKKVHNRRLECRVEYSDANSIGSLPIVSAIIQVAHVQKVNVRIHRDDITSGEKVYADCQAVTLPDNKVFLWTLLDGHDEVESKRMRGSQSMDDLTSFMSQKIHPSYLKTEDNLYDIFLPTFNQDEQILSRFISRNNSILLDVNRNFNYKFLKCWVGALPLMNYEKMTRMQPSWASNQKLMTVKYMAQIQGSLDEAFSGNIGDSISLSCSSDANPEASVSWFKILENEREIFERFPLKNMKSDDYKILSQMKSLRTKSLLVGTTSIVFNVKILNEQDFGLYVCYASNSRVGEPSLKRVIVDRPGPINILPTERIFGKVGEPGKISCRITGIPKPDYRQISWYRHGLPIIEDKNHQFYYEDYPRGLESILYFKSLGQIDFTLYNCTAQNGYGSDWKTIELVTIDEIPMAFAIGSGTAILLAVIFSGVIFFIIRHSKKQIKSRKEFQIIQTSKTGFISQYYDENKNPIVNSTMELRTSRNNLFNHTPSHSGIHYNTYNPNILSSPDSQTPLIPGPFNKHCANQPSNNLSLFPLATTACYSPCEIDSKQCTFLTDATFISSDIVTNNESNQSYDSGTVADVYNFPPTCSNINSVYLSLHQEDVRTKGKITENLPIFYTTSNPANHQDHLRF